MLVTDHPHLFEAGGENYHTDFGAWDYLRGHEDDPWRTRPDPSWIGAPALPARGGAVRRGYDLSRTWFRDEADFPGPQTMIAAAEWLDHELGAERAPEERALLVVDEFDPHEPFDTPEPWASRYDPDWEGERLIWPPYATDDGDAVAGSTEREGRHLRAQYGAKLSMIDHWLGRILDVIDRHDAWDTTAFVLCTDHGHYLGERGMWGKPQVPVYPELGHIPLLISWPGVAAAARATRSRRPSTSTRRSATSSASRPSTARTATSLVPLLDGTATSVREWALCGVWGREVHVADATRTFARAPGRRRTGRCRCTRTGGRRCRSRASPTAPAPARPPRPARPRAGQRRAGDPPAVRPERRPPVLGRGPLQRRPALRPRRGRRRPARSATRRGGPADRR